MSQRSRRSIRVIAEIVVFTTVLWSFPILYQIVGAVILTACSEMIFRFLALRSLNAQLSDERLQKAKANLERRGKEV